MRTAKLLSALSQDDSGIQITMRPGLIALVATGYQPRTVARGESLFKAAMAVAADLMHNPQCPPGVRKALEEYDDHTRLLRV